jgi:hypothetical protein
VLTISSLVLYQMRGFGSVFHLSILTKGND